MILFSLSRCFLKVCHCGDAIVNNAEIINFSFVMVVINICICMLMRIYVN